MSYYFIARKVLRKSHPNISKQSSCQSRSLDQRNLNSEFPILSIIDNERLPMREPTIDNNNVAPKWYNCFSRNHSNLSTSLLIAIIVVGCVLFSSPILLYPQHNAILHPEYWYELIISASLSFPLTTSLDSLIVLKYYIREGSMVSLAVFTLLYVPTVTVYTITYSMVYLFWTVGLSYNHPMPLTLVGGYIPYLFHYMTLNLLFYKQILSSNESRKRIRSFDISRIWALCMDFQFRGLSIIFTLLPSEYQWILAFVIPLLREFNFRMVYKIMIDNPQVKDGKMTVIIGINTYTALYVAIKLGQTATQETSVLILLIDFILNIYSSLMIVNKYRSTTIDDSSQRRHLKELDYLVSKLILVELLEVLVPVSYVITVLIAYYGPNAEILGNIRNDYWQYESIDDIWETVTDVLIMFIFDGLSAVISGFMLWRVCSIDVFRKTTKLIHELWPVIAVNIANYLNYVSLELFSSIFTWS